jgi:adenosylhomocysteinase
MQFLAMKYLLDNKGKLSNNLYTLPDELNNEIAALKLECIGLNIDKLTEEQNFYLNQE